MANYFSKYQGRGGPAIAPGIVQMMGSIGDEYAKGIEGLTAGIEKYRQNKETRDILEETALNEYARQLPAEGEEADPMKSEYLSQYGEKVRDASDMSMGELKGLVSSMQTDRNEMQKQRDHELQEKIYDLKERDTARLEAATIADIAGEKEQRVLTGEKQIADILYQQGMLGVAEAKNVILQDKLTSEKLEALDKKTQAGKTLEQNQTALRKMWATDNTSLGKEVQEALKEDFDPETIRPWIDTKIKAASDAAVTELDMKPVVHDLGKGQRIVTFGKTSHMLENIDGKLRMQPKDLEQLKVRMGDQIAEIMSGMSYASELSRSDPNSDLYNPDAKTPIQTQIEKLLGNIDEMDKKYGADSTTSATTPAATTPATEPRIELIGPNGMRVTVPESQKQKALDAGYTLP
tara:strand:- start:2184 stop:3401 length:1218 start_codon:yes stop_codon:yes gene_type:complete